MTPSFEAVVIHTPVWVWIVLALIVARGLQRMRPHVQSIRRVVALPLIVIGLGLLNTFLLRQAAATGLLLWIVGWVVFALLGARGSMALACDSARGLVRLPGSVAPLLRILLLFGAHYLANVEIALHSANAAGWQNLDLMVSGAGVGYFSGWLWRFHRALQNARPIDLAGPRRGAA